MQETNRIRKWGFSCEITIFLFSLLYVYPFLAYFGGRKGFFPIIGWLHYPAIFWVFLFIFIICILTIVARVIDCWKTLYSKKLRVSVTVCVLLILLVGIFLHKPWYVAQTEGIRAAIPHIADISAIRQWVKTIEVSPGEERYVDYDERPDFVKSLNTPWVFIEICLENEKEMRMAKFLWSGHGLNGETGLIIGLKEITSPPSSFEDALVVLSVEPGVYVWFREK